MKALSPLLFLSALAAGCGDRALEPIAARGTVEVPEVDLSALTNARVVAVRVEEGAAVQAGDTLALLTQAELGATLAGQRARIATAMANLRDLESGSRPEELRRAEAEVSSTQAEADRAAKELGRIRDLAARDVVSQQALDDAVAAERVTRGRLQAAEQASRLLQAGSRQERIVGARAEVASAQASLAQVEARAGDLVLTAPVSGIVLSRNAEPGEALGAGVPVLTLGETGRPYVRVFVPQSVVRGVRVGDSVLVVSGSGQTTRGRVAAINPQAEFTPRVALTEQERDDLMFGIKVEFADPAQAPYPGLWVTVRMGSGAKAQGRKDAKTQGRKDAPVRGETA